VFTPGKTTCTIPEMIRDGSTRLKKLRHEEIVSLSEPKQRNEKHRNRDNRGKKKVPKPQESKTEEHKI
jgi:hypothetical protein